MRDVIARALTWSLLALTPRRRPGRHTSTYLSAQPTAPGPAPVNPWSRPWTGPTKEEAAALFRQQETATLELRLQRERRHAAALATFGIDYPYTYDGAPFGPDAFTPQAVSA